MFKGIGKIEVRNGIRIVFDLDLILYYNKLIEYHYYRTVKTQLPMHGAHITIVNPKIHGITDFRKYKRLEGTPVKFLYFPEDMYVSKCNWWIPVKSKFADNLKRSIHIYDKPGYLGLHMTVANRKFN